MKLGEVPEKALKELLLTNFVAVQNAFAHSERLLAMKWFKLEPSNGLGL